MLARARLLPDEIPAGDEVVAVLVSEGAHPYASITLLAYVLVGNSNLVKLIGFRDQTVK